jgi:hypothetical protein
MSSHGKKLEKINGEITFKDVFFEYPARKGVQVAE